MKRLNLENKVKKLGFNSGIAIGFALATTIIYSSNYLNKLFESQMIKKVDNAPRIEANYNEACFICNEEHLEEFFKAECAYDNKMFAHYKSVVENENPCLKDYDCKTIRLPDINIDGYVGTRINCSAGV